MRFTAVRGWDPLSEDRSFAVGADFGADLSQAVACEHRCESPSCDIREALEAGFSRVAAYLLGSAIESPLLDALYRAHRFNATADPGDGPFSAEWQDWHSYWDEAIRSRRLWNCPSCNAWSWDSATCGACSEARRT